MFGIVSFENIYFALKEIFMYITLLRIKHITTYGRKKELTVFVSLFMHDRSTFPDNPLIFDEMRRRDEKTW
jgi:hypothetical protein